MAAAEAARQGWEEADVREFEHEACARMAAATIADPGCVPAWLDLGDFFAEEDADRAAAYYDRATSLLRDGRCWKDHAEEVDEAFAAKAKFLIRQSRIDEAERAILEGRALLGGDTEGPGLRTAEAILGRVRTVGDG